MKLQSLKLENFRLFKEADFEFKPLTLLVGANSSGKSSISKALMLLKENLIEDKLRTLKFNSGNHKLGSFNSVLSRFRGNDDQEIRFLLKYKIPSNKTITGKNKKRTTIVSTSEFLSVDYSFIENPILPEIGLLNRLTLSVDDNILICIQRVNNEIEFQLNIDWISTEIVKGNLFYFSPKLYLAWDRLTIGDFENEFNRRKELLEEEKERLLENFENEFNGEEYSVYQSNQKKLSDLIKEIEKLEQLEESESHESVEDEKFKQLEKQLEKIKAQKQEVESKTENTSEIEEIENLNKQWELLDIQELSLEKDLDSIQIKNEVSRISLELEELINSKELLERSISEQEQSVQEKIVSQIAKRREEIKEGKIRSIFYEKLKVGSLKYFRKIVQQSPIVKFGIKVNPNKSFSISHFLTSEQWFTYILELFEDNDIKVKDIVDWTEDISFIKNKLDEDPIPFYKMIGEGDQNEISTQVIDHIKTLVDLVFQIPSVEFISAMRGFQERFYKADDSDFHLDSSLSKVLSFQNNHNEVKLNFINKWACNFGILSKDEVFEVKAIEGKYLKGYIRPLLNHNYEINIADKGLGYTQLLPIIIEVASLLDTNSTIIIEEPVTFLHPNLQSKFVDFIIDAISNKVSFIIETHSEYLIRKLQYITAESLDQDLSNKMLIYNLCKGFLKKIFINRGYLSEDFEDGFYDEASKWLLAKELSNKLNEISTASTATTLILTEDQDTSLCELIFHEICLFDQTKTLVESYDGRDNLYSSIIASEIILKDKPNISKIIFHRDRDSYSPNSDVFARAKRKIEKLNSKYNSITFYLFITDKYDLEAYFINSKHIQALYPNIDATIIETVINEARNMTRNASIERMTPQLYKLVNEKKNQNKNEINYIKLALKVSEIYDKDPSYYSYGKKTLRVLSNLLKEYNNGNNVNLVQYSEHIVIPELLDLNKA